jgi:hypothetical protein
MNDAELREFLVEATEEESFALLQAVRGNPALLTRVLDALPQQEQGDPEPPPGYVRPPKPGFAEVLDWATTLENRYKRALAVWRENLEFYQPNRRLGTFGVDRGNKDFERFYSSSLADDTNLAINLVGSIPVTYQLDARRRDRKRDAQEVEDYAHYVNEEIAYRHAERGYGEIGIDETKYIALCGAVVSREVLDLSDPLGVSSELLDIGTCFPFWGGNKGMQVMVRCYSDSVANVVGDYGDARGDLERRLRKDGGGDRTRMYGGDPSKGRASWLTEKVDVIEYWDTWWRAVYLRDGRVVVAPTAHKYAFVPFVYQRTTLGLPGGMRSLQGSYTETRNDQEYTWDEDQMAEENQYVSFFHWRKVPHAQKEAILSKHMHVMRTADRPPKAVYQTVLGREGHDQPEISYEPGAVTPMMEGDERLESLLETSRPDLFGPLLQAVAQDMATGQLPLSMYGATGGASQQTGNAIEGMNESGRDKLTPLILTRQLFKARQAAMRLRLVADWGHLIGEDGRRGEVEVPYRDDRRDARGDAATFTITPATIKRAGTRIKVELTSLRLQNLPALLNAGAIGLQTDQMTLREALHLRGVKNPHDHILERIEEKALLDPENKKVIDIVAALKGGNPELAQLLYQTLQASGAAGPPGGGAMMPGDLGLQGPNTSAGNVLQAANPNVGAGAGRPALPPSAVQIAPPSV